jgi:protein tyrosine/serine phosphatase
VTTDPLSPWIALEGAANARDLGGLPAAGGRTRYHVLLRADALDGLTDADVAHLVEERRLSHVVDLRTDGERRERGRGRLGATTVAYCELAVIADEELARRSSDRAYRLSQGMAPHEIMALGYEEFLTLGGAALATAFERIVAPGGVPALVHCSAGKDRTGVLVALLLDVAGVSRDAIVADYARTHERMDRVLARLRTVAGDDGGDHRTAAGADDGGVPDFALGARAETMVRFLELLDARGGAAAWFGAQGVADATLQAWHDLFIEPLA